MTVKGTSVVATIVLTLCSLIGVAEAQQRKGNVEVEAGKGKVSVDVDAKQNRDANANRRDKAAQGMAHRASEIQGMTVKNKADEELGTVKDIVIDVRAGQVKYAALSYGGFLGVGDKLFAVPWDAFEHRHEASDDEHTLVLNIDQETLKNAPGFHQSEWPNFADGEVAEELEKHYGKFRRQRDGRTGVDIQAGPVAVDVDVQRNRDRGARDRTDRRPDAPAEDVVHRASEITGMAVKNTAGKDLGSVNDLVVDMDSGKLRYAALSYGGFIGLGDKLFAVPWDSFDCQYNQSDEKYHLVLAIDETTLRKAPGFDQDNWPNLADPKFGDDIEKHYGPSHRRTDRPTDRPERTQTERSQPQERSDQ
jgi:sporulation protein YlmC with PRC-barrel domain